MNTLYADNKRQIGTPDCQLLVEAAVVGLLVVVVGLIVHFLVNKARPQQTPDHCKDWNKNHIMEICLFITGAMTHIVCEYSGVNQWYVNQYKNC